MVNTEIGNLALMRAGASKLLTDLDSDRTPEAQQLRLLLPLCRDKLLESFPWYFATKRVVLAEVSGVTRTDWTYVYAVPTDMLSARAVVLAGSRYPTPGESVSFRIEAGDDDDLAGEPVTNVILCDQAAAEFVYTCRCTLPVRFSSLFTDALAWYLAMEVSINLTKKDDLHKRAVQEFAVALQAAKDHSCKQERKISTATSSLIDAGSLIP